jgi:hypothetical protein
MSEPSESYSLPSSVAQHNLEIEVTRDWLIWQRCFKIHAWATKLIQEADHPNLNLTQEEKRAFFQLFQAADTTNIGVITGEHAVPFFEKTKLPPDTLGLVYIMTRPYCAVTAVWLTFA